MSTVLAPLIWTCSDKIEQILTTTHKFRAKCNLSNNIDVINFALNRVSNTRMGMQLLHFTENERGQYPNYWFFAMAKIKTFTSLTFNTNDCLIFPSNYI